MHVQKGLITRAGNKATNLIKEYITEKSAKSSFTRSTAEAALKKNAVDLDTYLKKVSELRRSEIER